MRRTSVLVRLYKVFRTRGVEDVAPYEFVQRRVIVADCGRFVNRPYDLASSRSLTARV